MAKGGLMYYNNIVQSRQILNLLNFSYELASDVCCNGTFHVALGFSISSDLDGGCLLNGLLCFLL